jgi:hypothetical protein
MKYFVALTIGCVLVYNLETPSSGAGGYQAHDTEK